MAPQLVAKIQGPEFNPQYPLKVRSSVMHKCNPNTVELETGRSLELTHWLASLAESVSFRFRERPCLKN